MLMHNYLKEESDDKELEFDQYISENCSICEDELTNEKYIYVDENDKYLCFRCMKKYNISAVRCLDIK